MYTAVMAQALVNFLVRMSPELHAALRARAEADNRSLNNLIVTWLRRCVDEGW
jgi:predicted HicB family RNase H-like nuclease